jgi:GntR family transcriptional regulator/MocR family aminotransferase
MLPMLRLGFLVAPASLQPSLRRAKQLTDWQGDLWAQGTMARFIDAGLFARHIRRATRRYAARHQRIVAALRDDFAGWLRVVPSAAGLHVCARARPGLDARVDEVIERARDSGIAVESLAAYCDEVPAQSGLVLGYGAIPLGKIGDGMRALAALFRG